MWNTYTINKQRARHTDQLFCLKLNEAASFDRSIHDNMMEDVLHAESVSR